jgi:SAM-dependent methyltransferase
VDWNDEWNLSIRMTRRDRLNSGQFWDEQAGRERLGHFPDTMLDDQLRIIRPRADQRILEIGPGSGRLTIPLARSSSEVTVVDPSPRMLTSLEMKLRSEGLSNVRFVNDRWERLEIETLGRFHKLVSSYSLFMNDIGDQMERMSSISDEVSLFVPGDLRIPPDIQEVLFDEVVLKHTDYEILSNLAADLGYHPKSFIIEYPNSMGFDEMENALNYCFEFFYVPEHRREQFTRHLLSVLVFKERQYFLATSRKVGVICWQNG